jgi:hypothetical protein
MIDKRRRASDLGVGSRSDLPKQLGFSNPRLTQNDDGFSHAVDVGIAAAKLAAPLIEIRQRTIDKPAHRSNVPVAVGDYHTAHIPTSRLTLSLPRS